MDELVRFVVGCGAEEVFAEAVNPRGPGLRLTEEALRNGGFGGETAGVSAVRGQVHWSVYVLSLVGKVQQSMRKHSDIGKLRFLLYPARLLPEDRADIKRDQAGVVWL